jgi:V/A-type H+-transporting ATPase subunit D
LPTLLLKKQQLQMKILEARRLYAERGKVLNKKFAEIDLWAGLLADSSIDIRTWVKPQDIFIKTTNIAGANVPVYDDIHFPPAEYDLYTTPFWVDRAIEEVRLMATLLSELKVIREAIAVLEQELRVTTQRVNLFEKVKIPESRENIRVIRIFLGDAQTLEVARSKIAKGKALERETEA